MRILLHMMRSKLNTGGASITTWDMAEALAARGHDVRAYIERGKPRQVRPSVRVSRALSWFLWPDVVLGPARALHISGERLARAAGKKVVGICRGAIGVTWIAPGEYGVQTDAMIWGSGSYREHYRKRGTAGNGPDHVMWPAIDGERYRTTPGDFITLVGLTHGKGIDLLRELATLMPGRRFLAVPSGWASREQKECGKLPPNVTLASYSTDARSFYRRTRILLYPRGAEAGTEWIMGIPRVAVEAAVSGIPTIAYTPNPGLEECFGGHATYVASHDAPAWADAIRRLDDYPAYFWARQEATIAFNDYPKPDTLYDGVSAFLEHL